MVLRQTHRVHEHLGPSLGMVVNSRTLLATTALGAVCAAVVLNVLRGGSTIVFMVLAISLILGSFIWFLFNSTQASPEKGATVIRAEHSIGRSAKSMEQSEPEAQQHLPDPLEAGIDVPLF